MRRQEPTRSQPSIPSRIDRPFRLPEDRPPFRTPHEARQFIKACQRGGLVRRCAHVEVEERMSRMYERYYRPACEQKCFVEEAAPRSSSVWALSEVIWGGCPPDCTYYRSARMERFANWRWSAGGELRRTTAAVAGWAGPWGPPTVFVVLLIILALVLPTAWWASLEDAGRRAMSFIERFRTFFPK